MLGSRTQYPLLPAPAGTMRNRPAHVIGSQDRGMSNSELPGLPAAVREPAPQLLEHTMQCALKHTSLQEARAIPCLLRCEPSARGAPPIQETLPESSGLGQGSGGQGLPAGQSGWARGRGMCTSGYEKSHLLRHWCCRMSSHIRTPMTRTSSTRCDRCGRSIASAALLPRFRRRR